MRGPRLYRFVPLLAAAGILLGLSTRAAAEPEEASCGAGRPWVELEIQLGEPAFSERVLADLRAGLAGSRIDVCVRAGEPAPAEPLARLSIQLAANGAEHARLELHDAVTEKVLEREIDLGRVPSDGRAFALAVAAEELLRASWAELSVPSFSGVAKQAAARATAPAPPAAADVRAAPRVRRQAFGLRFAYESYRAGLTQLGADLFWGYAASPRLAVGVAAGGRQSLTTTAPDGSISASALALELSAQAALLGGSRARLDALLALSGKWLELSVEPGPSAQGRSAAGVALYARGGLELSLGGPGICSRTRVGLGAPLIAFSAADAGQVVTGLRDVELFSSTGVAVVF